MRNLAKGAFALFAVASLAPIVTAQTIVEIPYMTVANSAIDMDGLSGPGGSPTTLAAINAIGTPKPGNIGALALTASTAAAGVYNTSACNGRGIGLDVASGKIIAVDPPTGAFDAFDGSMKLGMNSTEWGIQVGDWVSTMTLDFYSGPTLVASYVTSSMGTNTVFVQMQGGPTFNRVDFRASSTVGNWVLNELHVQIPGPPPPVTGVWINEFYTGAPDFAEIYNNNSYPVDVSGWTFACWYSTGSNTMTAEPTYTFPAGTIIAPGGFLVVEEFGTAGAPGTLPCSIATGFNLFWTSTRTHELALIDAANRGVDYVFYDYFGLFTGKTPNLPAPTKWSGDFNTGAGDAHVRKAIADTDTATDWAKTADPSSACAFNVPQTAPKIIINEFNTGGQDYCELLNTTCGSVDVTGWEIQVWYRTSASGTPVVQPLCVLPTGSVIPPGGVLCLVEGGTAGAAGPYPNSLYCANSWGTISSDNVEILLSTPGGAIPVDWVEVGNAENLLNFPTGNKPASLSYDGAIASVGLVSSDIIERITMADHDNANDFVRKGTGVGTPGVLNAVQQCNWTSGHISNYAGGCAGVNGDPLLYGTGCTASGSSLSLEVAFARAGASALLLLGAGTMEAPMTAGCDLQILPLLPPSLFFTFASSELSIPATLPPIPVIFDARVQIVFADAANPWGIAATNALKLHLTP